MQTQLTTNELERVINRMPVSIAVIDNEGNIVFVNEQWKSFGRHNDLDDADYTLGDNYLEITRATKGMERDQALQIADGIQGVITGKQRLFEMEYPCHAPTKQRWFVVQAAPVRFDDARQGAVVMHVNITSRVLAEQQTQAKIEELEELNALMIDRELKMKELKEEIQQLRSGRKS